MNLDNIPDKTVFKSTTSHKFKQDVYNFFKDKNLDTCLEIGTNRGWTTRILSDLFKTVHTIEFDSDNMSHAKQNNFDKSNVLFYLGDAYDRSNYNTISNINVAFIDCIHTYDAVLYDINTCLSLMDLEKGLYIIFDDYGHPTSTGVKQAILEAINSGLKIEQYIGEASGYQYNDTTTLIDHEGIILSYGI